MSALPTNTGPGKLPGPLEKLLMGTGKAFNTADNFLQKPGGSLLMNLLAQQGYSTMPGSPLGAIGRAGLATQQQQRQSGIDDLNRRLTEAQIQHYGAPPAPQGPQTSFAKLMSDINSGLISPEDGERLISAQMREGTTALQGDTRSMRDQFRKDVGGPRASLSGLSAAESLLASNNAIADTAAFTSFIRAIDNSVVRPAEQEAYNKALGLRNQIEATVQQWAGKGPLPPQTKRALLESVRSLRDTMEGIVDRTVSFYNKEAVKFDLDAESVTGLPVKFGQIDVPIDDGDDTGEPSNVATLEADIKRLNEEIRRLEEDGQ